jgi:hypothetical protein
MGTNQIGEPTMTSNDGPLACSAKILVASDTLRACHAAPRKPTESNTIPRHKVFHHRSDGLDAPDNLVAGNKRIRGKTPLIAKHAEV